MSPLRTFLLAAFAVSVGATARAQIVPIGPFTGTDSEGWESQAVGFRTCVDERVFTDQADCCYGMPPTNGFLITSMWAGACVVTPRSGNNLAGANGSFFVITFDTAAARFGGYFTTNSGTADGEVRFYDAGGNLIGTQPITAPSNCSYAWSGWEVQGGPLIKMVELYSNHTSQGRLQCDDLEADIVDPCPDPITYCTAKPGLICGVPAIDSSGTASATATSGFEIFASPARLNRSGLIIYTNAGPAAIPFQGGTLCLQPAPLRRTSTVISQGPGACNSEFRLDMNAFASGNTGGNPDAFLQMLGTTVNCQWWGRDSVATGSFLSDGLEFEVCN